MKLSKPTLFNHLRGLFSKRKKVSLTQKYTVELTSNTLSVTDPKNKIQSIPLNQITTITVETNDGGPWGMDVWFIVAGQGADQICVYPMGATNEDEALDYFLKLPGFELKGMDSTTNEQFICWAK